VPFNIRNIPNEIPHGDALNNKYVRIVHLNGIHHLAVVFCSCQGDHLPFDLMFSGFVPSTFQRINTIFTTKVLDMFRLSNLELKASAYQYFQLLHRLTSRASVPSPDLYNDLRKVSRAWRWMKKLKWAGYGHKKADPMKPTAGDLTVFCPACPQANVNLPPDWKSDPNRYSKYIILLLSY
jgi:CxC2 like cysteine cluster associated with KDZ transposases